jgi:hypothetical protein
MYFRCTLFYIVRITRNARKSLFRLETEIITEHYYCLQFVSQHNIIASCSKSWNCLQFPISFVKLNPLFKRDRWESTETPVWTNGNFITGFATILFLPLSIKLFHFWRRGLRKVVNDGIDSSVEKWSETTQS